VFPKTNARTQFPLGGSAPPRSRHKPRSTRAGPINRVGDPQTLWADPPTIRGRFKKPRKVCCSSTGKGYGCRDTAARLAVRPQGLAVKPQGFRFDRKGCGVTASPGGPTASLAAEPQGRVGGPQGQGPLGGPTAVSEDCLRFDRKACGLTARACGPDRKCCGRPANRVGDPRGMQGWVLGIIPSPQHNLRRTAKMYPGPQGSLRAASWAL